MRGSEAFRERRFAVILLFCLIVAYPVCYMWQGLDVSDTGWILTNMQQFFHSYPKDFGDGQYTCMWLTNFVGACWYRLTGGCGLLGFRVLYVLMVLLGIGLVYLMLRKISPRRNLFLALLAGIIAVVDHSMYVPGYNELTALLFVLTAALLYFGLTGGKRMLLLLSGVCAGASVFARLPNVLIIGIAVAIVYDHFIRYESARAFIASGLRSTLNDTASFVAGYLIGIGGILLLVASLGQLSAYSQVPEFLFGSLNSPSSGHGSGYLLRLVLVQHYYVVVAGCVFLAAAALGSWAIRGIRKPTLRYPVAIIVALLLAGVLSVHLEAALSVLLGMLYAVLLPGALGLLGADRRTRLLCVLAGLILFIISLGSNNGIWVSYEVTHMAVPVACLTLLGGASSAQSSGSRKAGKALNPTTGASDPGATAVSCKLSWAGWCATWLKRLRFEGSIVGCSLLVTFVAVGVPHRFQYTYRDSPDRWTMTAHVENPRLRGILTTPSKARALNELLEQLVTRVRPDDYLLDHMQLSMIYFLTDTVPYLYSAWPNLYVPSMFRASLAKALRNRPTLPVCIMTKIDTSHPLWPDETYPPTKIQRHIENRKTINEFLQEHNYRKTWENSAFEIWEPPSVRALDRVSPGETSNEKP